MILMNICQHKLTCSECTLKASLTGMFDTPAQGQHQVGLSGQTWPLAHILLSIIFTFLHLELYSQYVQVTAFFL